MNAFFRLLPVWVALSATVAAQSREDMDLPVSDPQKSPWHVGLTGAMLLNSHHQSMGTPGDPEQRTGFALGVGVGYDLDNVIGVNTRLEYRSMPGRIVMTDDLAVLLPNQSMPQIQRVTNTTDIPQFRSIDLSLTASLKSAVSSRVSAVLAAGPFFRNVLEGNRSQYSDIPADMKFINPNGLETENNGQRLILQPYGPIAELNKFQAGLTGGIGVQYRYGSIEITPAIWYDHTLTNVASRPEEDGWRVHSWAFRTDVRVGL
ncbi:MAG: outer membrane beta-barrel protein [Armatimonadetes bacterium]|nr:outer membrane beta-barrel protein [Armatimonadota bacterium]